MQGSTFVCAFATAVGSARALIGVAPFATAAGTHAFCWALRQHRRQYAVCDKQVSKHSVCARCCLPQPRLNEAPPA